MDPVTGGQWRLTPTAEAPTAEVASGSDHEQLAQGMTRAWTSTEQMHEDSTNQASGSLDRVQWSSASFKPRLSVISLRRVNCMLPRICKILKIIMLP